MKGLTMRPLTFTKDEAATISLALDKAQKRLVMAIAHVKRKRSWRSSEKAMAIADYTSQLNNLTRLNAELCDAFGIRGY